MWANKIVFVCMYYKLCRIESMGDRIKNKNQLWYVLEFVFSLLFFEILLKKLLAIFLTDILYFIIAKANTTTTHQLHMHMVDALDG